MKIENSSGNSINFNHQTKVLEAKFKLNK